MNLLFDGEIAITGDYIFAEAPVEMVAKTLVPVSEGATGYPMTALNVNGRLRELLVNHLPLKNHGPADSHLIVPTKSKWCAVFSNTLNPPSPRWATTRLNCRGLRIVAIENTISKDGKSGRLGGTFFELYDSKSLVRSIICYNDCGKWTFLSKGDVQTFETPTSYMRIRKFLASKSHFKMAC